MLAALKVTAWLAGLIMAVTVGLIAHRPMAAHAASQPPVTILRYVPRTILCSPLKLGRPGLVIGDGRPFEVVCEHDGPVSAWDAEPWDGLADYNRS